jgi:hypothetical protein
MVYSQSVKINDTIVSLMKVLKANPVFESAEIVA